jgi:aerobic-type carbon monoxide dehydrogenase small subunit (CoxS/CutS family)
VRDNLTMNDFLREYLRMTGTKFGCGAAPVNNACGRDKFAWPSLLI